MVFTMGLFAAVAIVGFAFNAFFHWWDKRIITEVKEPPRYITKEIFIDKSWKQ